MHSEIRVPESNGIPILLGFEVDEIILAAGDAANESTVLSPGLLDCVTVEHAINNKLTKATHCRGVFCVSTVVEEAFKDYH